MDTMNAKVAMCLLDKQAHINLSLASILTSYGDDMSALYLQLVVLPPSKILFYYNLDLILVSYLSLLK